MTTLLITNDDGIGAPALRPLAEAMRKLGRVVVAAPSKERSWIGKAISRHGEIEVTKQVHNGIPMWAVGGYPADCVQVGSFGLLDQLPDLVISGINIGANKGSAFSTGSGTIAAAFITLDREKLVLAMQGFNGLLNVILPSGAGIATPRRMTTLARTNYGSLFRADDGVYRHDWDGVLYTDGDLAGSDLDVLDAGMISITPIRMATTAPVEDRLIQRIERSQ